MNYADQVRIWRQWDSCVNFGSPISAWTPRMLEIASECEHDIYKMMDVLDKERRENNGENPILCKNRG